MKKSARQSTNGNSSGSQLRSESEPAVSSPPKPVKKPQVTAIAKIYSGAALECSCKFAQYAQFIKRASHFPQSVVTPHLLRESRTDCRPCEPHSCTLSLSHCVACELPLPPHLLIVLTPWPSLCIPCKSMCAWQARSSPPHPGFK